ncbi:ribokinase [Deinococcus navajonensis]|uniref:Ribokinase n=1 Tax=Deinococcus navajonensis TaxID=309884 RepID=A0ABV8XRY4_9DEIO
MSVLVVGSVNVDITVRASAIPAPGETVLGPAAQLSPGGKGANQAVASALAGAPTSLWGAVGADAFQDTALRGLRRAGVALDGLHRLPEATGLALITVDPGGENAITVASGANAALTAGHLLPMVGPGASGRPSHLLLQQELPEAVTLAAAQLARAGGLRVVLNAAPARAHVALLALVHHLVLNEHELEALAGPGDCATQARRLLAHGPEAVTVTLGAHGHLTVTAGRTLSLPALTVSVVDTTGAGDTFCGVMTARLARGEPLEQALKAAGVAAALTCTRPGAQDAMPDWAEVQAHRGFLGG